MSSLSAAMIPTDSQHGLLKDHKASVVAVTLNMRENGGSPSSISPRVKIAGIKVQDIPGRVGERLRELDVNGDGVVDAEELSAAVMDIIRSQTKVMYWRWFVAAALLFILVQTGIMAGIIYGIVVASREVTVENNFLVAVDSTGASHPVVTSPYAWGPQMNASQVVSLPELQLNAVGALTVNVSGYQTTLKVGSILVVPTETAKTVMFSTASAVLTVNASAWLLDWTDSSVTGALGVGDTAVGLNMDLAFTRK